MIRVLIADDHALFRQGLRQLLELESDIQVVGEAADGIQVQQIAGEVHPDIVLIDISMPVVDGVAATGELLRRYPALGVIVLTMYGEEGHLFRAIRAGARGYLLKTATAQEVVAAVRSVHRGASLLDPVLTTRVLEEFRRLAGRSGSGEGLAALSETEVNLLRLIASGLSNKEIAHRMGFAPSTVKNKLSLLFSKLAVQDRTQAAVYAMRHGLLPAPFGTESEP